MATVGQVLTAPEEGWRRLDDRDKNISYIGTWTTDAISGEYNTTITVIPEGVSVDVVNSSSIKFNFTGTSIRFIHSKHPQHSKTISYKIDGELVCTANMDNDTVIRQILGLEKTDLVNKEHSVEIYSGDGIRFDFDCLDIDATGELKPYSRGKVLLRITMNDSSEREYYLLDYEADEFVKWCNRTVDTGNSYYIFNKAVGSQNSKEYLFFEKIISFGVIELK